jgi:hypothetical protein
MKAHRYRYIAKEAAMAATHDELRDELVAAMEASPELDTASRAHLADVFLDRLNSEYRLVPKSEPVRQSYTATPNPAPMPRARRRGFDFPPMFGLAVVVVIALVAFGHVSLGPLLPIVIVLLVFRAVMRGGRRGQWGPRRY